MTRKQSPFFIIGLIIAVVTMFGCGLQIVKPGPVELADLAWSTAETIVVFMPGQYRDALSKWKPDVEDLKLKLEAGESLTGEWVKDIFLEKLTGCIIAVIDESGDLSDVEKEVLVDDFKRSFSIIHVEGEIILTADQRTILYGAVMGVLSGIERFEEDPVMAKVKMRKELNKPKEIQ